MHDIAHAAADAARVPDFDDVLVRGRRHRNRRQGLVAGAAAVAVAAILGVTQVVGGGDDGAPQPAPRPTEVPTGSDPTNIPYWVDGSLHVGDVVIDTDLESSIYAAGTTVVGPGAGGPNEYHLVDGSDLVPIVDSDKQLLVTLSRDGRLVVLLELLPSDGSQRLMAWDVETRSEVASVDIPVDDDLTLLVVGIDDDHRVFLTDLRTALMWVPGQDPVPVTGVEPGGLRTSPWPGGLAYERTEGTGGIGTSLGDAFGTVDDDGAFHEVGTVSPGAAGFGTWSPTGEVLATYARTSSTPESDGSFLGVEYADGREPANIELPDDEFWLPVAWESETQLLLQVPGDQPDPAVSSPTDDLARCDVVALTCTRIDEVPEGAVRWATDAGAGL